MNNRVMSAGAKAVRTGAATAASAMGATPAVAQSGRSAWRAIARKVPYRPPSFWKGQAIGLLCAAAGLAIRLSLSLYVGDALPVTLFYPFVLVAAVWGGACSGV